jgi:hypothetical protein
VTVYDNDGNSGTSATEIYHFAAGAGPDETAPSISAIAHDPSSPAPDDVVTISATILDSSGVSTATLQYRIEAGAWQNVTMSVVTSTYSGDIPAQVDGTTVYYRIVSTDTLGNEAVSSEFSYTVHEVTTTTTTTTTSTTSTTTTTTTTTTELPLPMEQLVLVAGGGIAIVVILMLVMKRRK